MKKTTLGIFLVLIYAVSAGASFVAATTLLPQTLSGSLSQPSRFARLISPLVPGAGKGAADVDANAPKTEECPLNGQLYTVAERNAWEGRTPLAVMIENHPEARPQSGLSRADVIYEAVAEGGITRFMAMYYCGVQAEDTILAPIRSARTYFIDWASTYQDPLYVHVGGANLPGPTDALGQLDQYGWAGHNDLNQFSIGFPTFARNYNRVELAPGETLATEHTMETSTERLWKYAADSRDITTWTGANAFKPWAFKEDDSDKGTVTNISHFFWDGYNDFKSDWAFDAATNMYTHSMGGQVDIDQNTKEPVKAKNVVIMFTTEKGPINENKHMLYGTTGTGKALIFQDGKVVEATWSKPSREGALTFTARGKDVPMNRGLTWISTLATGTDVSY